MNETPKENGTQERRGHGFRVKRLVILSLRLLLLGPFLSVMVVSSVAELLCDWLDSKLPKVPPLKNDGCIEVNKQQQIKQRFIYH